MPQLVSAGARFLACDPTRVSRACRNLSIQRASQCQMHERHSSRHVIQVSFVYLRGFVTHQARLDLYTFCAQVSETLARNPRIQIFDWRDDTVDARGDKCVCAGRGASPMRVWLERDVGSAAACFFPSSLQSDRLGVFDGFENVEPFTDNFPGSASDNTTNQWPGTDLADALHRQIERTRHHAAICVGPDCRLSYGRLHKYRIKSV